MIILKQSTITDVVLGPFIDDTDGKTTEEALTLAQADLQLTKNGATAAQKNDATSATHLYGGNYKVDLNATDTNTVGHLRLMCKETGALPVIADFMVVEEAIYDALFGASAAGFDANGRVDVGSVAGTAQTANDNGADINTLLTRIVGTLAAGTHNAQSGDVFASLPTNFGDLAITITTGQVTVGTNNDKTGYSISGTKTTLDALNDIAATSIVSAGAITTLAGAVVNVDTVDTCTTNSDMRGTDSAALASVCTEARLAELDAANLPTDISTVDTVVDGIQTDLSNATDGLGAIKGAVDGLNDLSAANVNAEVLDVLNTDTFAEPTGVPGATVTLATKLGYLYMALRNQVDVTSTKKTFYDDGGVAEWEKDLSDNGTTYSESEGNAI